MKSDSRIILAIAIAISISSLPTKANSSQSPVPPSLVAEASANPTASNVDLNRAKNLARQAAEAANGGLTQYRAESSMHGAAEASPFVDKDNGNWTFTFKGKKPDADNFTIETVVSVSKDGKQVTVDYNGPIRQR